MTKTTYVLKIEFDKEIEILMRTQAEIDSGIETLNSRIRKLRGKDSQEEELNRKNIGMGG